MRERFQLGPSLVFLNHGSFGACPLPVRDAQRAWQDAMERNPVEFLGRHSAALLRAAREKLAAFVDASAEDLVFVPNATTGVNIVAQSLTLQPGDEVLGTTLEYGACDAAWQFVCARQGAHYRRAAIALPLDDAAFVDAVMAAVTPRTRLVFASHIASTTALVLPMAALVGAAHARGLPVLVDGAHAPGQLDLALDRLGADYYTGNGHKWLCGPKGSGFLHARREHHERLHANVISWGYLQEGVQDSVRDSVRDSVQGRGGHTGFDAYLGASGFERRLQWQGTRDISGFLALPAAIDFHREHLGPQVRRACHAQAVALMHELAEHFRLPPIGSDAHFAQMAAIPVPACDAEALRQRLFAEHRIEVPVTRHEGRSFVRVSVQGYNRADELQALSQALKMAFPHG